MFVVRPFFVAASVLAFAGLAVACMASGPTSADSVPQHVAAARDLASQVSESAYELLRLVNGSEWGARYSMLNPRDPETSKAAYRSIKAAEMLARNKLAAQIRSDPRIDLAFLAYGEFVLLVERRFETDEQRQEWLETSGGDMYAGPFARFRTGEQCEFGDDENLPDVSFDATGAVIGVPVCHDGRYVCALYVRRSSDAEAPPGDSDGI